MLACLQEVDSLTTELVVDSLSCTVYREEKAVEETDSYTPTERRQTAEGGGPA